MYYLINKPISVKNNIFSLFHIKFYKTFSLIDRIYKSMKRPYIKVN